MLRRLAKTYSVPAYYLFEPNLTLAENIPDFRTTRNRPAVVTPRGLERLTRAESLRQYLSRRTFHGLNLFADGEVLTTRTELPEAARVVQKFLGPPKRGNDASENFRALRLRIDQAGIGTISEPIKDEGYRGFALVGDEEAQATIIFVNSFGQRPETKTFTLLHEFVHVLLKKSGVSDPFHLKNNTERYVNKVVASYLMPKDEFVDAFRRLDQGLRSAWEANTRAIVNLLASAFLASKQATAIRVAELGLLPDFYRSWIQTFPHGYRSDKEADQDDDRDEESSGGGPFAAVIGRYGYFIPVAFSEAVAAGKISQLDPYRLAHIKPKSLSYVSESARERLLVHGVR